MKKLLNISLLSLILISAGFAVENFIEAKDLLEKKGTFNLQKARTQFEVLKEQIGRMDLTRQQIGMFTALEEELFPKDVKAKYNPMPYVPNSEQRKLALEDLPGYVEEEAEKIEDIDIIEFCELDEDYVELLRENISAGVWWNQIVPAQEDAEEIEDLLIAAYLEVPYEHGQLTDEEQLDLTPCRYPLAGGVYLYTADSEEVLDEELGPIEQRLEIFKRIKFQQ